MKTSTDFPNTYDIAEELIDCRGWVSHDVLFEALQDHWTDDGCCERIDEAVENGVLIEVPTMRYRLGERDGFPDPSLERDKLEQILLIKMLLSEFEKGERRCHCPNCFADFIEETREANELPDNIEPQLPN